VKCKYLIGAVVLCVPVATASAYDTAEQCWTDVNRIVDRQPLATGDMRQAIANHLALLTGCYSPAELKSAGYGDNLIGFRVEPIYDPIPALGAFEGR
jgi:hypothetical protein